MDAAGLLDQYKYDTTNLPSELKFLVQELKVKDAIFQRHVVELDNLEQQLSKYSKQGAPHPKEDQIAQRIEELYGILEKEETEKTMLSNTALWGVTKHLSKLEYDIDDLVKKGIIDGWDIKMNVGNDNSTVLSVLNDDDEVDDEEDAVNSDVSLIKSEEPQLRRRRTPTQSRGTTPMSGDEFISHPRPTAPPRRREVTAGTVMRSIPRQNRRNPNDDDDDGDGDNEDDELYCFCQQVSFGAMVACDNPNCKYEWFHYSCVGLKAQPDGVWYCPDCRKDRANRKERRIRK